MRAALVLSAIVLACASSQGAPSDAAPSRRVSAEVALDRAVAEVDARYLSIAVDTAQVVGGTFWDPNAGVEVGTGNARVPPYDFARPRLRALAQNLAPAYLRIGGSDADRTHYDMSGADGPPPAPFKWTLTRAEWDGVADFARALDFPILFTLNAGPSVRSGDRAWKPDEARVLLDYTRQKGYPIALWELGNEINAFPVIHGFDATLKGDQVARDAKVLRALAEELTPGVKVGAPSSAFWPVNGEFLPIVSQMLEAGGGASLDVLTWHYYPQQSRRCPAASRRAELDLAFSPEMLDEIDHWARQMEELRDKYRPDLPIWLGESGNAQCGGEPGISDTFAGGFWWIDELGRLARRGHRVVVRQTLSGSNYGLLDDATLDPRPDYWISVLYKRLVGARALDAKSDDPLLRLYAHCGKERGTVVLLYANLDRTNAAALALGVRSPEVRVFELTAPSVTAKTIALGGKELLAGADGSLPPLEPLRITGGVETLRLAPASYGFVVATLDAPACR